MWVKVVLKFLILSLQLGRLHGLVSLHHQTFCQIFQFSAMMKYPMLGLPTGGPKPILLGQPLFRELMVKQTSNSLGSKPKKIQQKLKHTSVPGTHMH